MAFSLVSTDTILARNAGALYGLALGSTNFTKYVEWMGTQPDDLLNFVYSNSVGATSTATVADVLISSLGITGVEAIAVAKDYIVSQLDAVEVADRGAVVDDILGMFSNLTNDAVFGPFATAWNSRIAYAVNYGNQDGTPDSHFTASSVGTFTLTTGVDTIYATDGHDTFAANVVQNTGGYQVNTLGSGDYLDGGAGTDTLNAKITNGAFAGGSYSMPIQPETKSIEVVKLEAVRSDIYYDNDTFEGDDEIFVNAKDMEGVEQLWSNRSDADLTIMNLTTKGLSQLSDMTIGMAYTGNADSQWGESDYHVYFDQDYLTPEATRTNPSVEFLAMNEDNYDATEGQAPLDGVFFRVLNFTLNGETFELAPYLGEDVNGTGSEIKNYNEFLTHVQDALVQLKAEHPENAALQSVVATIGDQFETDVNPITLEVRVGTAVRLSVDGLTGGVENTLEVKSTDLEVVRALNATVPNNNRYELAEIFQPEEGDRIAINVALEKVGLAGDGGELVIGSMNKQLVDVGNGEGYNDDIGYQDTLASNIWNAVETVVDGTTSGIEEFNVTVYGDASKSSSLSGLHSTNNNLRVVTVATDAAVTGTNGYADLTIGNSNTATEVGIAGLGIVDNEPHSDLPTLGAAASLKDVQTFDASAFKGDLHLHAALTREVADKYLDLVDEAPDAADADNVAFDYTGGEGDDYINIALDTDNSAFSGTVTREDFLMNLSVKGGAGDDMLVVGMANASGLDNASRGDDDEEDLANWYLNQKKLANVRIDGGEGNDTIWKPGSGDVIIDAGTGNDTVYADNTGTMAQWVLNYNEDSGVNNIESGRNHTYDLFKTDVVVSFRGFEASAAIVDVRGKADDLAINQAIKAAINSDPVLSKLLVAADGPGYSLVITSLIDGNQVDELSVTLDTPTAAELTAGDVNNLANWYGIQGLTAAQAASDMADVAAEFNAPDNGSYLQKLDSYGSNSLHVSDNTITGDLGDDVLVLGTGRLSNDTVVYEGFGNGTDTIVNFDTGNLTDTTTTTVDTGRPESFTVTFADINAATNETVTFDTISVLLNDGVAGLVPAEDVALAFAEQYGADVNATWSVSYVPGSASVTLTNTDAAKTPDTSNPEGNVETNIVKGDFDFTTAANDGTVVISNYVEGLEAESWNADATPATFTLDFDPNGTGTDVVANANGTIDYLGATISYTDGDGAITLAQAFAGASYTDWNAELGIDGTTVIFTAKTAGVLPAMPAAPVAVNGVDPVLDGLFNGTDAVTGGGTYTETTEDELGDAGIDYLDFSDYNAVGVVVDGLVFHDVAALGENYVRFTENADNLGEYTVEVFTEAGATDTLVGTVGVLDFGATQTFVEQNFII